MSRKDGSDRKETSTSTDLLERLLSSDAEIERLFEKLRPGSQQQGDGAPVVAERASGATVMQAVVPGEVLEDDTLDELLSSVAAEYEEIEDVLGSLRETAQEELSRRDDAVAFVSEEELADPTALAEALKPLQGETAKFELLYDTARMALDRLAIYRLSRSPTDALVQKVREDKSVGHVRYLVEFLRSLQRAAASFEALEIPEPHVRDYLRYLYLMQDWGEMSRLVKVLEMAVTTTLGKTLDELVVESELAREKSDSDL